MIPKEELRLWKIQIGHKLRLLKEVKDCPDNFTPNHVQQQRDGLSLAISWRAKLYRLHPDLRPQRVKQMNLFPKTTLRRLKKKLTAEKIWNMDMMRSSSSKKNLKVYS